MSAEQRILQTDDPLELSLAGDPLVFALAKQLRQCGDELGVAGCACCPVAVAGRCRRLWREVEKHISRNLGLREFRQYSQRFHTLREERNCILARRGTKLVRVA